MPFRFLRYFAADAASATPLTLRHAAAAARADYVYVIRHAAATLLMPCRHAAATPLRHLMPRQPPRAAD